MSSEAMCRLCWDGEADRRRGPAPASTASGHSAADAAPADGLPSDLCPTMRTRHRLGKDHPSLVLPLPRCRGAGAAFSLHGGKLLSWPGDAVLPREEDRARGL